MTRSNRFVLIIIGVGVGVLALVLITFAGLKPEDAGRILPWVEGLLAVGIGGDTVRRMGGDRGP